MTCCLVIFLKPRDGKYPTFTSLLSSSHAIEMRSFCDADGEHYRSELIWLSLRFDKETGFWRQTSAVAIEIFFSIINIIYLFKKKKGTTLLVLCRCSLNVIYFLLRLRFSTSARVRRAHSRVNLLRPFNNPNVGGEQRRWYRKPEQESSDSVWRGLNVTEQPVAPQVLLGHKRIITFFFFFFFTLQVTSNGLN